MTSAKISSFDLVLPQNLPLSLHSHLVEQRPDVRQYQALLHVASAKVGVATANMLPQFTISGGLGTYAAEGVNPAILAWSAAAGVAQPIFEVVRCFIEGAPRSRPTTQPSHSTSTRS
jgi:outer membrane protein TolC